MKSNIHPKVGEIAELLTFQEMQCNQWCPSKILGKRGSS